jgi:hypothetical protein
MAANRYVPRGRNEPHVIFERHSGDELRFNPHLNAIGVEGGFDEEGRSLYIPSSGLPSLVEPLKGRELFHTRMVGTDAVGRRASTGGLEGH